VQLLNETKPDADTAVQQVQIQYQSGEVRVSAFVIDSTGHSNGYSSIFFLFAAFTVVYFIVAVFFLPETKGKTLEEIEAHFEGKTAN